MKKNLVLLVVLFIHSNIFGQATSMKEAIDTIEAKNKIKISYDADLIKLVQRENDFPTNLDEFHQVINEELPFILQKVTEEFFTISSVPTLYSLAVVDSGTQQSLSPQEVIVSVNSKPIPFHLDDNLINFEYQPTMGDSVFVYFIGHQTKKLDLQDLVSGSKIQIAIEPLYQNLPEIIISDYLVQGIDLSPHSQSINIDVNHLPLLPGETDGDIFASIASLPGITNPDLRAGNLFIRGSETDQTLVLFDDIPIYHRGHYYGTISPYNPKIVDNVQVYRSGYHPRYGDRVGGAIVINTEEAPGIDPKAGVGINTLFGMGYLKTTLFKDKLGVSIGARRSYPSDIKSPKLNAISESIFDGTAVVDRQGNLNDNTNILFEDYHIKLTTGGERLKMSVSGIYTDTKTDFINTPPPGPSPRPGSSPRPSYEENSFTNKGLSFTGKWKINQNLTSTTSSTISDYRYAYITDGPAMNSNINELKDFGLEQEFMLNSGSISYQFGMDYQWKEVLVHNRIERGSMTQLIENNTTAHFISQYSNIEINSLRKWYFQIGLRNTYYSLLDNFRMTPRLFVNYELSPSLTFKTSAGLYNQYLSQVRNLEFGFGGFDNELWTLADEKMGHIIEGVQATSGFVFNKNDWIFDVEAFYKDVQNVTIYDRRKLNPNGSFSTLNQKTYGVDFMIKRSFGDLANTWLGYSYNDSQLRFDSLLSGEYKSKYVQPHVLYLGNSFLLNQFKFSSVLGWSSGLNAQSLDIILVEDAYNRMPPPNSPPGDPFADRGNRYVGYFTLNVSASYKIPKTQERDWSASFGLSIVNLLNSDILVDEVFRTTDFRERYATKFAPNIMIIFEW